MHRSLLDPLSVGVSRQEYWSGKPFPVPGDLPNPGIELGSPPLQADSLLSSYQGCNVLEVKVKVAQSCPTLCNPMDCTLHGILQASTLDWGAFPVSRGSSQPRDQTQVSRTAGRLFTSRATSEA